MDNNSQNNGILPADEDKTLNTHQSGECSPDFFNELLKIVIPDFHHNTTLLGLVDGQFTILDSIKHQLEFIQSLAFSADDNGFIDIKASSLRGVSESLLQQVALAKLSVGEVHRLNQDNLLQQKITELEATQGSLMRLVNRFKNENADLKGSEYKIVERNV